MGRIAILGVFVADVTFRADRAPAIGETIMGRSFALGPGGKGSNQAVAAARAGGEAAFIVKLAKDIFGEMALSVWKEAGVEPRIVWDEDGYTGAASIFVDDASGDNAIIICPGAAGTISAVDVGAEAAAIAAADVFVTQLEQPVEAAQEGLRIARAAGVRTILNPAPARDLSDEMLGLSDIVTPNESEAEALTGIAVASMEDADRAARALLDRGTGAALITLGEAGSLFRDADRSFAMPAMSAGPVVETTGAGDAFNGGLAVALAEGQAIGDAVRFATATAALSVTKPGTAGSMPQRKEIERLLAK